MSDESGAPVPVGAQKLAEALCPPGQAGPALVGCNFYNSAASIAATAVAHGAGAAIGFQDEIDDFIAERFFGNFYTAWHLSRWNLLEAFRQVLGKMRATGEIQAAGLVLWSAQPLVQKAARSPPS